MHPQVYALGQPYRHLQAVTLSSTLLLHERYPNTNQDSPANFPTAQHSSSCSTTGLTKEMEGRGLGWDRREIQVGVRMLIETRNVQGGDENDEPPRIWKMVVGKQREKT